MYKVYYNGTLIHDPSLMSPNYILLNGKCSVEAGKVDTMDFTILPNHPFYNTFTKLQTGIVAYRDDVEIFRGRILSSTVNMNGEKSVQCEGSLAYLLDSIQPIMKVDGTVSCANLFRTIIANHNNQVEAAKQFQVGIISAAKASDQIEVNQTSYTETRSMIDSYLLNTKGGYLRARFENNVQYIDWIEDFGRNPNQPFMIGANIVEMSEENSTDDFYTILLPLGKEEAGKQTTEEEIEEDKARDHTVFVSDVNGGSPYMPVSNEYVQAYGRIYHMENYGTVSSPAELKAMANDTLDQFRKKLNRTVEITGLDLHFLDPNYDQILIGDRVNIIAPNFNKNETLMATKIDYDFSKPQGDRYSFGDGVLSLTRKTETGISTTKKTAEKAKDNSLTNGRDLLIKKNLIDIEANKLNLKVNDAMNITAKYVKWTFDAMAFGGKSYSYSPADKQRIRGELADRWSDITRTMEGYISPEQGLADFKAISDIVTDAAEQVNTIYTHLDSDQGLFQWGVESKNLAGLGNKVNNVELILNGPSGTGGLVSQVHEIDETGKQQGRLLREAGIYVNPDTGAWLFNTDHTTGLGSVIKAQDDKASMVVTTKSDGTYAVNVGEIALAFNNQTGQSTARINADKIMISTGSQNNPLDSYLALQDGKINLVVHTDSQGNWVVNPASIVAAVNNGESSLVFNADHLDLRGLVTITDMHAEYGTGDQLSVNDIDCDGLLAENIEAAMITANYFIDADGNFLNNAVKTVQIISAGNNSYKLQYNTFDNNNWQDAGTFSRATTLTGAWSSGVYTVTASPQRNTISTEVSMGPGRWDSNTPNLYRGDIYYSNDGGDNAYPTGATYVVDATSRYNAGYAAGMIDGSVTTLGGSWNNGTFTVTATPQGDTISVGLFDVPTSDVTWNGNTASFPVKANLDGGETAYNTGKTLSIDATSRYNAGYTAGQSDGGLAVDYVNNNISAANSPTKVVYIQADASISYNSTTHTYTATGIAKVAPSGGSYSNMDSTSTTSGTEAYGDGYVAGYDDNNTAYIEESSQTLAYGASLTVHARYKNYEGVSARSNAENSSITITAPVDRYNAGVADGYGSARLSLNVDNHTVNIGNTGGVVTGSVAADAIVGEFDGESMAFPVTVQAKINSTVMAEKLVWVEAFIPEEGGDYQTGYDNGYRAGLAAARLQLITSRGTIAIGTGGNRTEVGVTVHASVGSWDSRNQWTPVTISARVDGVTMASSTIHVTGPYG